MSSPSTGVFDTARMNRREVLSDGEVQVVHCINRCVRRAFLCGEDPLKARNKGSGVFFCVFGLAMIFGVGCLYVCWQKKTPDPLCAVDAFSCWICLVVNVFVLVAMSTMS